MAQRLRVMTYNVHSCTGSDGYLSPSRIAAVIYSRSPDVIALQELDLGLGRSGGQDQARVIADLLRMEYHFHPSLQMAEGLYGNAVLSRFPLRPVKAGELPRPAGEAVESRGALWVEVALPQGSLHVVATHLGLGRRERIAQAAALAGDEWCGNAAFTSPGILCGDLNTLPRFNAHRILTGFLRDAQEGRRRPRKTWPGRYPLFCIDHILLTPGIAVDRVEVPRTPLTRRASDHLPLLADLVLP